MGVQPRIAAGLCLACCVLSGCGSSTKRASHSAPSTPCTAAARTTFARFLALPAGAVAAAPSTGNNTMPQCTFTARDHVSLTVNIYTGPQPYFLLERTAVETGQMLVPTHAAPPPQTVTGLGIDAYWFPDRNQLMSTDGVRLITASVSWTGASLARQLALATALSRMYLTVPRRSNGLAKGYPSPSG